MQAKTGRQTESSDRCVHGVALSLRGKYPTSRFKRIQHHGGLSEKGKTHRFRIGF